MFKWINKITVESHPPAKTSCHEGNYQHPRQGFSYSLSTAVFSHFVIYILEPTVVPPVLLDLCTVAILHRFSSPTWWQHLIQHVPTDFSNSDAFDKIVRLQVSYSDGRVILVSQNSLIRQGKRLFSLLRGLGYLQHLKMIKKTKCFHTSVVVTL